MPQEPLVAPFRVIFRYVVSGFTHKCQMYCDAIASGAPSGWSLRGRAPLPDVFLDDVVDPFFTILAPYYVAARDSFVGVELLQRSGSTFVHTAQVATTVTPSGSGGAALGWGMAIMAKDALNHNLPFYIYESNFFAAVVKISSYAAGGGFQPLIQSLTNAGGGAIDTDPWNWRVSKGDYETDRFVSMVADSNEKLRRRRGLK